MRKLVLVALLISCAVLFLPGCAKANQNEIKATFNTAFDLPVGKTAVVKGEDIAIKFDSVIADSRCPSGVTCIWAGEAKCKLLVTQKARTKEVILIQSGSSEGTATELVVSYRVSISAQSISQIRQPDICRGIYSFNEIIQIARLSGRD